MFKHKSSTDENTSKEDDHQHHLRHQAPPLQLVPKRQYLQQVGLQEVW